MKNFKTPLLVLLSLVLTASFALSLFAGQAKKSARHEAKTFSKSEFVNTASPTNSSTAVEDPYYMEYKRLVHALESGEELSYEQKNRYEELVATYESSRSSGGALDNQGGPDTFGYLFVDNQGGDTATYNWIELRGDNAATWINFTGSHDDAVVSAIPLGLTFPFYGSSYTTVNVSTNGTLQFSTNITTYINDCLPTTAFAGPTVFLYWDDLHLDHGGNGINGNNTIAYRNFGDYFVIEYDSIGHCCAAGTSLKFQAIFYADGRIKMQYNNLVFGTNVNTQTIGIQSTATGPALQYDCNATGPQPVNNLAVWFYQTGTGSVSGTVRDAGNNQPVSGAQVRFAGSGNSATTDGSGNYSFPVVPGGSYTLISSKQGFLPDTNTNVTVTVGQNTVSNFAMTNSGLLVYSAVDCPVGITDNQVSVSNIVITQSAAIVDLDVGLNITHTFDADLFIVLVSPEGDSITLSDNRGGAGDNFVNTIFDDEATTTIAAGVAPFTGSFIPDELLGALDTHNILGTWTLVVADQAGGDIGTINGWDLYITPGATDGGSVTGTIERGVGGADISGVTVTINTTPPQSRVTNATGNYSFGLVPAGTYTLTVSGGVYTSRNWPNVVVTQGNTTQADVQLYVSIAGTVTAQQGGAPIPGAQITITGQSSTAVTDASGHYEIGGFAAGTYTVNVTAPLYNDGTQAGVAVTETATATTNFALGSNFVVYASSDGPVPISDNDTSYSDIVVADDFTVESVSVLINDLTHTFDADLTIWAIGPTGIPVLLSERNGGAGDNFVNTLFDDAATTPIANGTAPFTGTYLPEEPLAALVGFSSEGTWRLRVYDGAGADQGNINQWSIVLGGELTPHGTLSGTILTLSNLQPLAGAVVTVVGANVSATTNAQGNYTADVSVGTYSVVISHAGYCDSTRANIVITEDQTTDLDVSLRAPVAVSSVTSINAEVVFGGQTQTTFTLSNTGNCPLTYTITDTSNWLSAAPANGTLNPGGTPQTITVSMNAQGLPLGDYLSRVLITHNANGSPTNIPVTLTVQSVSADDHATDIPTRFALTGNYPNPFNSMTEIRYDVPKTASVSLVLYNLLGQEVKSLVHGVIPAGHQRVFWDARDNSGLEVGSGIYILQMTSENTRFTGKVMLVR